MPPTASLSSDELRALDAYRRASNYLSVGQIYRLDNPPLRRPLALAHVKPRLLGHWGTTPVPGFGARAAYAKQAIRDKLIEHKAYIREHGDDLPEIRGWRWSGA